MCICALLVAIGERSWIAYRHKLHSRFPLFFLCRDMLALDSLYSCISILAVYGTFPMCIHMMHSYRSL